MREINFRVWDNIRNVIRPKTALAFNKEGALLFDYETLMQYTGLKDKNGVEIYGGDIVRITTESNSWNSKVGNHGVWHEILVYDSDLDIDFISINYAYDFLDCEIEVIGNIYENPELLN